MTDFFTKYLSKDPSFHVIENEVTLDKLGHIETIFTLGNGFLGSRGILEEMPSGSNPGTFIAGMFDMSASQVEELINLPNPINLMVAVEGEKFDIFNMKVLDHKRILDMKNACLIRRTVFRDAKKRQYLYQSVRFFSMDDPHVCSMKVSLKLLKGTTTSIALVARIDDSVYNSGGTMLPRKRHFNTFKADKEEKFDYISFRTNHSKQLISYGDALIAEQGSKKESIFDRFHQFDLSLGQEISFTKYFAIYTSYNYSAKSIKRATMMLLSESVTKGFDKLFKEHLQAMHERWLKSDIEIDGDNDIQKSVRFNIYHLMISAREEYAKYNIGAKTLSGEGYRGHIFWDTEIYMLPFFIYTDPEVAKELLMFRVNTLPQARQIAKEKGYKGAMYPWEATASGTEQTPRYSKAPDGNIVEVHTQDYEHHITGDVAYGIYNYCNITGDMEFLKKYGAEVVFETARFWASRVEYSKKDKQYHINSVIGPDEFHVDVNDNAYTNYLAKWNLNYAADLYDKYYKKGYITKYFAKFNFSQKEIKSWRNISSKIAMLYSKKHDIMLQFDGYLKKKDYPIKDHNDRLLPVLPVDMAFTDLDKTTFLKQCDVLALYCLFPDDFTPEEKLKNYHYYLQRTAHLSSLSYCMHAILANDYGDYFRSFCFFWGAVNIDLLDVAGNVRDGIHAANLGGIWQAMLFGYAGIKCSDSEFSIVPRLPGIFKRLKFRVFYKDAQYVIEETPEYVKLSFEPVSKNKKEVREVNIFGNKIKLHAYATKTVKLDEFFIQAITAQDILKQKHFITINESTAVREIGGILEDNKVSGAPVVDNDNKLIGMISDKNILQSTYRNRFGRLRASDIMESEVVYVKWNDSIEKVAKVFTTNNYRRLPVVKNNKVIGVIYRKELIKDFLKF